MNTLVVTQQEGRSTNFITAGPNFIDPEIEIIVKDRKEKRGNGPDPCDNIFQYFPKNMKRILRKVDRAGKPSFIDRLFNLCKLHR